MANININVNSELNETYINELVTNIENAQGVTKYEADYSLFVEVDTEYDDKKPPVKPLIEWAKRNVTPKEGQTYEDVGYAIQQYIYENGIDGVYFLTFAKNDMINNWEDIASRYEGTNAPTKLIEEMLKVMLQDSKETLRTQDKEDTGKLINSGLVIFGVLPDGTVVETEI